MQYVNELVKIKENPHEHAEAYRITHNLSGECIYQLICVIFTNTLACPCVYKYISYIQIDHLYCLSFIVYLIMYCLSLNPDRKTIEGFGPCWLTF